MAKTKGKKKQLSEKIQKKRMSNGNSKQNMLEMHINKQKMQVLGRKTKHAVGFPGLSRSKAIDKRKKTLLQEYKDFNKSNVFKDERIAERNNLLSNEDKQTARFTTIRKKANKKSIFNLGDDDDEIHSFPMEMETLTHSGQTISDIEKYEDPRSDDENDNDDDGRLDKKFVEQVHFGGFLSKQSDGANSHKDILEQIIAESKKKKAEKKQTKAGINEQTEELNDFFDKEFDVISSNLPSTKVTEKEICPFKKRLLSLKFAHGKTIASGSSKTVEQIAEEEKKKLEKLEKERLDRMIAEDDDDDENGKYGSVDDLEDNLVYESNSDEDDNKEENDDNEVENEEDDKEVDEDDNVESDSEDDFSDLKADTSDSEEETNEKKNESDEEETQEDVEDEEDTEDIESEVESDDDVNEKRTDLSDKTEDTEEIAENIPFPEDDEKLEKLLKEHSPTNQGIIIEKLKKSFHPSLSEGNKEKLGVLFKYLLQYIDNIASEATDEQSLKSVFSIFNEIVPHLFDLAQWNEKVCSDAVREIIKEKFQSYIKKPKVYANLEVLLFLKLVSVLFPTSDFKHGVVTPCFLFIEKMLMSCQVRTRRHIAYGLFLSTLVLEYTSLSKRYMPGCINFLGGIIHMAIPKTVKIMNVVPPFKFNSSNLVLIEDNSSSNDPIRMEINDLVEEEITESFKVRAICTAVKMSMEFFNNFKNYPSNLEIFKSIYTYCKTMTTEMYPAEIRQEIDSFVRAFEDSENNRVLNFLELEAERPKILKLYTPKIIEIFDRKTHKNQSKKKAERDVLIAKLKAEKKGTLRELRRDNAFLARVEFEKTMESDRKRKEAVKRIFADLNTQQSELNEMDRKRKKK